ncbi:hypothetical protein RNAN_1939 [Rheinheimera nanhaiensis E407-8]|uniref:Uncharacterized protein n=1 Tax=Rheinheimera nanhaiensis E407-8 TaxID=562729 RepID=I1DY23_9GAMM|nr:hypothetical protein RNAN_1939 [Rheinheimera nanhaiensis E407-8]
MFRWALNKPKFLLQRTPVVQRDFSRWRLGVKVTTAAPGDAVTAV